MKKTVYIVCVCVLSVLVFHEARQNWGRNTDGGAYVPTSGTVRQVAEENAAGKKKAEGTEGTETEKPEKKTAYLTFDDGPSETTRSVLKTLKEKKAVATFFLIGNEITPEREGIVKQEVAQGNAVGVHTYCHKKNQMYCDADSFFEDFQKASQCIERVTGQKPKLHRFPWGSNNRYVSSYVDELYERLRSMGIKSYDWNVSGEDAISRTVAQATIYRNVKKDLNRSSQPIILLHDSASTKNTAAVLGQLIDYIRSEGYEFATLENREEYMFPASWRR